MSRHESSNGWGRGGRERCPREKAQHVGRSARREVEAYLGTCKQFSMFGACREERVENMQLWGEGKEVGLYHSGYLY